jgi:hypothetical protein
VASQADAGPLLAITNTGDGGALDGTNASTTSNVYGVRGVISSTSPGGFSAGVRGANAGTGGLGIGVWGSQDGSGWGVYGSTPNGLGVYGNASDNGYGVYANSNTGTGLNATSNNGIPANFSIYNNANNNNVLVANTVGNGTVVNVTTTGNGAGVRSSTSAGFALHGITSSQTSAGVVGDNNGGGEAVVGRTTSDIAGAVVGRNDGGGSAVGGFIATDTSDAAIGVYGQVGLNNSTGRAGRFENFNTLNTQANALEVFTNGNGNIGDNSLGNAASFVVDNNNSVAAAVRGEVNTIFGNLGAAGVFGVSSGTGGFAGLFHATNPAGNGVALLAINDGNGSGLQVNHNGASGDLAVFRSNGPSVARIDKTGRGYFNGGTQTGGADLAEFIATSGPEPQPGDVVEIDPDQPEHFRLASTPYSPRVAGVITTDPGVTMNARTGAERAVTGPALALAGRVPVKVSAENGAVRSGDLLVASGTPGHAMRAPLDPQPGTVIGKALQPHEKGRGEIQMLVMLR